MQTENELNYVVGDAYKFTQAPAVFFLSYLVFRHNRRVVDSFLRILVVLVAGTVLYNLVDSWALLESGYRVATKAAYFSSFVIPVQLYFLQRHTQSKARVFHPILLCVTGMSLVLSQWRTPILVACAGLVVFWVLQRGWTASQLRRLLPVIGVLIIVVFFSGQVLRPIFVVPAEATLERFRVLGEMGSLQHRDPYLVSILGSRLHEVDSVSEKLKENPFRIPFGFGMGSTVEAVHGVNLQWGSTHYVHLGWAEIVLRTGVVGLAFYVALSIYFLSLFLRCWRSNPLASLSLTLGVQHILSLLISSPFATDPVVFCVYGLTIAVLEQSRQCTSQHMPFLRQEVQ